MPKASIAGVGIAYEVRGRGVPAIFIHGGYGGAATTLVPQPSTVGDLLPPDQIQTITYDRRNAGRSDYTAATYRLSHLAEETVGLLDHLGIDQAIVIGSSAGGPIALQVALSYPARVIALGLPNTGANLSSTERAVGRERRALVAAVREQGDAAVFAARHARLRQAPAPGAAASEEARQRALERQKQVQQALDTVSDADLSRYFTGELRNYAAYIDSDLTPRLGELTMPVCIIHGDADAVVPTAWGEALHEGIAGSELHIVPGGGHGILAWPAGAAALRDWVLRVAAGAGATEGRR